MLLLQGPADQHDDTLVEADEILREPIDPGELDLRVGGMLRAQADRRVLQRKRKDLLGLYKCLVGVLAGRRPARVLRQPGQPERRPAQGAEGAWRCCLRPERRQIIAQSPGLRARTEEQIARVRYAVDPRPRQPLELPQERPLLSIKAQADSRLLGSLVSELDLHSVLIAPMTRGPLVVGLLMVADRMGSQPPFGDEDLNSLLRWPARPASRSRTCACTSELKRANELLQEYDRLKSEFVAIVAHDFRKPLMAIRGFAELVLEEPDIPPDARGEFMRR